MIYSTLASSLQVSSICFGCEPLGGADWGDVSVSDIDVAVERALELGVNFFDTADVYGLGKSEERLSKILGDRRKNITIATKGGVSWVEQKDGGRAEITKDSSPEYLKKAIDCSLKRLKLDRIPIFYVHWPDEKTLMKDTFGFLAEMQKEGKVGALGCSNFSVEQVETACQYANISIIQLPFNILDGEFDSRLVELCESKSIGIVAYNVLANGLLTGKFNLNTHFQENDRRSRLPLFNGARFTHAIERVEEIRTIAQLKGQSVGEYSIKWVLGQPNVVSAITGIKNVSQLEQNVRGIG